MHCFSCPVDWQIAWFVNRRRVRWYWTVVHREIMSHGICPRLAPITMDSARGGAIGARAPPFAFFRNILSYYLEPQELRAPPESQSHNFNNILSFLWQWLAPSLSIPSCIPAYHSTTLTEWLIDGVYRETMWRGICLLAPITARLTCSVLLDTPHPYVSLSLSLSLCVSLSLSLCSLSFHSHITAMCAAGVLT